MSKETEAWSVRFFKAHPQARPLAEQILAAHPDYSGPLTMKFADVAEMQQWATRRGLGDVAMEYFRIQEAYEASTGDVFPPHG